MSDLEQPSADVPRTAIASYAQRSAQPLMSLVFVTPMLIIYEVGVLLLGPQSMRNGAEVWLRQLLEGIGFGQYFLLPVATCVILLAWHHLRSDKWELSPGVLGGMACESLGLALLLLFIAQVQGRWMASWMLVPATVTSSGTLLATNSPTTLEMFVGFFGAGIYEELLFRLMMLPAMIGVLRWMRVPLLHSAAVAVLLSSLLFSLAHYSFFSAAGDSFEWYSFLFRLLAGIFFSVVFVTRGFGIAAGCHTLYDVIVGFMIVTASSS